MSDRGDRLARLVADRELDALLVTDLVNVRWLCGFTGTNGIALVGEERRLFMTDFRYVERAADEVDRSFDRSIAQQGELVRALEELLPAKRPLRLGFDDAHVTVRAHGVLREVAGDDVELVPAAGLVEDLRAVKDEHELEAIREAARIADAAFAEVVLAGVTGKTERAVALELEDAMRQLGAEEPSFPSIVAAGPHGALPHAEPRDVTIPADVLVVVDWGARVDGYCSDCTRTVATGTPSTEALEIYELVREAQAAALAVLRPGRTGVEVDAVARDLIAAAGHGERFGHGLGHGVGLEVHEAPRLARTASDDPLLVGNVVTIEPGVYLPGEVGVRIEDLAVLTADGHEVLSSHPKQLVTVG